MCLNIKYMKIIIPKLSDLTFKIKCYNAMAQCNHKHYCQGDNQPIRASHTLCFPLFRQKAHFTNMAARMEVGAPGAFSNWQECKAALESSSSTTC